MELESPNLPVAAHHKILAEELEKIDNGKIARLIVTMPPQNGKSTRVRQGVAWMFGRRPGRRIMHVGYAQKFAERNYGRRIQRMIQSGAFRHTFPGCKIITDSISFIETAAGGYYQAVGVDAPITGFGADLVVIDDPIKGSKEADSEVERESLRDWYGEVIQTRLSPEGAIIIVMTRWREDDLAGWVMSEHPHENWVTVNFPAILPSGRALWPERYSLAWLENKRKSLTERSWEALYMQRPTAQEGGILKRHWWKPWISPDPPECTHVLLSLDGAYSSKDSADFSAATVWGFFRQPVAGDADQERGADGLILLDAWHDRVEYPEFRNKVAKLLKAHDPDTVLIENKASGLSLIQELRRAGVPVTQFDPRRQGGDKEARANAAANAFSSGAVWYPEKLRGADGTMVRANFAHMVINECAAFPTGSNDDLVDTVTQAVLHFRQRGMLRLASDDTWDIPPPPPPRMPGKSYYA